MMTRGILAVALGAALVTGCGKSGEEASADALVSRKVKDAEEKKARSEKLAKLRADRIRQQEELRAKKLEALGTNLSEEAWLRERGKMVRGIQALIRDVEEEDTKDRKNPRWLTKPQALRKILDLGDNAAALSMARRMRHSSRAADRAAALDAFNWIGEKAMSDMTVMLADESPEIASEALQDWRSGLAEIADESLKAEFILEATRLVANEDEMGAILLELMSFDSPKIAVNTLDTVINDAQATDIAKIEARDTYRFVAGEAYVDSARSAERGVQLENDMTKTDINALNLLRMRLGQEPLTQAEINAIQAAEATEGAAK